MRKFIHLNINRYKIEEFLYTERDLFNIVEFDFTHSQKKLFNALELTNYCQENYKEKRFSKSFTIITDAYFTKVFNNTKVIQCT